MFAYDLHISRAQRKIEQKELFCQLVFNTRTVKD